MDPIWAIPLAVLIVSATTLVLTGLQFARVARLDHTQQLHEEVRELRDRLDRVEEAERQCQQDRVRLEREKLELLERLVGAKISAG